MKTIILQLKISRGTGSAALIRIPEYIATANDLRAGDVVEVRICKISDTMDGVGQ